MDGYIVCTSLHCTTVEEREREREGERGNGRAKMKDKKLLRAPGFLGRDKFA